MPCVNFNWVKDGSKGEESMVPVLTRCWGKKVQMVPCRITKEGTDTHAVAFETAKIREMVIDKPTLAVDWISTTFLGVLDMDFQLHIIEAATLHRHDLVDLTSLTILALNFTPAGMLDQQPSTPIGGGPVVANKSRPGGSLETYQNSFRCGDDKLYILGRKELRFVGLQSWMQRIDVYVNQGEWLEALALALDHYEAEVAPKKSGDESMADPKFSPLHPNILNSTEMQLAELLLQYVRLAIENAPKTGTSSLSRSHFELLSGVCIEYCMVTGRLDLLYGEIFNCFVSAGQVRTFLDMLEPYLLNEKLRHIGPEVLMSFIEHCQDKKELPTVERCLLHMDVKELDFNHVLTLLRRHQLFSGLTYVYSRGMGDYFTPLEILLQETVQCAAEVVRREAVGEHSQPSSSLDNMVETIGLKALLYLLYCFQSRAFPSGAQIPDAELPFLSSKRSALLNLVFQESVVLPNDSFVPECDVRSLGSWPFIRLLVCLDAKAVFETLSLAFGSEDVIFTVDDEDAFVSPRVSTPVTTRQSFTIDLTPCPSKEQICEILAAIIIPDISKVTTNRVEGSFLSRSYSDDVCNFFLEFMAAYMEKGHISMRSHQMSNAVLQHLASPYAVKSLGQEVCQERMTKLLQRLPMELLEIDRLLPLARKNGFLRAELYLHEAAYDLHLKAAIRTPTTTPTITPQTSADSNAEAKGSSSENHLAQAIKCYLADPDPDFRRKVFEFLTGVVAHVYNIVGPGLDGNDPMSEFKQTILNEMPGLFALDKMSFLRFSAPLFSGDTKVVLDSLEASGNQELQFRYLHAIVTGETMPTGGQDPLMDMQATSTLNAMPVELSTQDMLLYVRLMAKYRPSEVYQYVTRHDSYPLDECLRICQQDRKLMDATAYLLERTGDVEGALQVSAREERTGKGMGGYSSV